MSLDLFEIKCSKCGYINRGIFDSGKVLYCATCATGEHMTMIEAPIRQFDNYRVFDGKRFNQDETP